ARRRAFSAWRRDSRSLEASALPSVALPAIAEAGALGAGLLVFQEALELLDRQGAQALGVIVARDIGALLGVLRLLGLLRYLLTVLHISPLLLSVRAPWSIVLRGPMTGVTVGHKG